MYIIQTTTVQKFSDITVCFEADWVTTTYLMLWTLCQVCGHKWVDLSEHDWGVALMTNCKYGYSTHGNVMYISL